MVRLPEFPYFRTAMWPLFSKKPSASENLEAVSVGKNVPEPSAGGDARRRPVVFEDMIKGMGDLGDLRNHDTAIKFWLPEPADEALREYAKSLLSG